MTATKTAAAHMTATAAHVASTTVATATAAAAMPVAGKHRVCADQNSTNRDRPNCRRKRTMLPKTVQ